MKARTWLCCWLAIIPRKSSARGRRVKQRLPARQEGKDQDKLSPMQCIRSTNCLERQCCYPCCSSPGHPQPLAPSPLQPLQNSAVASHIEPRVTSTRGAMIVHSEAQAIPTTVIACCRAQSQPGCCSAGRGATWDMDTSPHVKGPLALMCPGVLAGTSWPRPSPLPGCPMGSPACGARHEEGNSSTLHVCLYYTPSVAVLPPPSCGL